MTQRRQGVVAGLERQPDEALELERGIGVCIPVFNAHAELVQCLHSVLLHTSTAVPILVADDAGEDAMTERFPAELSKSGLRHRLLHLRHTENVGFVRNANAALAVLAPADVVVLNSDCIVGPGWLERLRAAAQLDSTIATATALTNHGTILSVYRALYAFTTHPIVTRPFVRGMKWLYRIGYTTAAAAKRRSLNCDDQVVRACR